MKAKNKYSLPIKKKDFLELDRRTSPAHVGKLKNAVDFCFVKDNGDFSVEGIKILASANGEVVFVKDASKKGGPYKKYWNDGNRIVIKHKHEDYSAYEHLKFNGAVVKVGDNVKRGQLSEYSGNTGYTFGSHLHFEVFVFAGPNRDEEYQTLEVKFIGE